MAGFGVTTEGTFGILKLKKSRDREVIAARLYWDEDIIRDRETELWFLDVVENGGHIGKEFRYAEIRFFETSS